MQTKSVNAVSTNCTTPTRNGRWLCCAALFGALSAGLPLGAGAATVNFTLLADNATPTPGANDSFHWIYGGHWSGDAVFFQGWGATPYGGLFSVPAAGGTIKVLVSTQTPIPGGSGPFTSFNFINSGCDEPLADNRFLYFPGERSTGLYKVPRAGGNVTRLADLNTPIPAGPVDGYTTFPNYCYLSPGDRAPLLFSSLGWTGVGIFRSLGRADQTEAVVDNNTVFNQPPCDTFRCTNHRYPDASGSTAVYMVGNDFGMQAILSEGEVPLVTTLTQMPGGYPAVNLGRPSISGQRVAFHGSDTLSVHFGIHTVNLGSQAVSTVIDSIDPVPNQPNKRWTNFYQYQAVGRNGTLFSGSGCPVDGNGNCIPDGEVSVYLACGSQVVELLRHGQVVDGRTVRVRSLGRAQVRAVAGGGKKLEVPLVAIGPMLFGLTATDLPRTCL
jgi:hypothetical protein